jgi:hypothetical protein
MLDVNREVVAASRGAISLLVGLLESAKGKETQMAAGALSNLAWSSPENKRAIADAGAISLLERLAASSVTARTLLDRLASSS